MEGDPYFRHAVVSEGGPLDADGGDFVLRQEGLGVMEKRLVGRWRGGRVKKKR